MVYIATFFTHFGAIRFGRKIEAEGMAYHMMPVPRKLSSSCGSCVRFEGEIPTWINEDEEVEGFYRIIPDGYETLFENA